MTPKTLLDELVERAAIIEFCGNVPREEAERLAYEQTHCLTCDRLNLDCVCGGRA